MERTRIGRRKGREWERTALKQQRVGTSSCFSVLWKEVIKTGPIKNGPIKDGPIKDGPIKDGPHRTSVVRP